MTTGRHRKSPRWLDARSMLLIGAAAWLLVSAFGKLSSLDIFHDALHAHALVPGGLIPFTTWAMPILELAVGMFAVWRLLTGGSIRSAAIPLMVLFGMLAVYTTALAFNPPAEPAGCGCGISQAPVENWWPLAVRNAIATLILATCWLVPSGQSEPTPEPCPAGA